MGVFQKDYPIKEFYFCDEGEITETSIAQSDTEFKVLEIIESERQKSTADLEKVTLRKDLHIPFLLKALQEPLKPGFVSLDASRPWIIYWCCHGLDLMGFEFPLRLKQRIVESLNACQSESGGFGGGYMQLAHLATTYAAVNTVCILESTEGYSMINRQALYSWLVSLKQPNGSFCMHEGGEIDTRGAYCALSVASLLNICTTELTVGADIFLAECQSYEGGMGSIPSVEAHGGYTFCGLAAMEILGKSELLNLENMALWAAKRQMMVEGGFQGRTNKLVDGCYSFWQGGIFPILKAHLVRSVDASKESSDWEDAEPLAGNPQELFDRVSLQQYILFVAQPTAYPNMNGPGGLRDKPGVNPDFYHTCYNLSGLSIAQHEYLYDAHIKQFTGARPLYNFCKSETALLKPTHPVYNISFEHVANARMAFA